MGCGPLISSVSIPVTSRPDSLRNKIVCNFDDTTKVAGPATRALLMEPVSLESVQSDSVKGQGDRHISTDIDTVGDGICELPGGDLAQAGNPGIIAMTHGIPDIGQYKVGHVAFDPRDGAGFRFIVDSELNKNSQTMSFSQGQRSPMLS